MIMKKIKLYHGSTKEKDRNSYVLGQWIHKLYSKGGFAPKKAHRALRLIRASIYGKYGIKEKNDGK